MKTSRFFGKGVAVLCAMALLLSLTFSVAWSVSAADGTVEFNGSTYNYEIVGSYMDLFAGSGYTAVGNAYTRTTQTATGWDAHDIAGTVTTTSYLYYDLVIEGGNLGIFLNGWDINGWIGAVIAEKHGKTPMGDDQNLMPEGTYRGVIDVSSYTVGTLKMALQTENATVTVNELAFVNLTEAGGSDTPSSSTTTTTTVTPSQPSGDASYEITNVRTNLLGDRMYSDGTGSYTQVSNAFGTYSGYTVTQSADGWFLTEQSFDAAGTHIYYDLTVSEGGYLSILMDTAGSGVYNVSLAEAIAANHGVTTVQQTENGNARTCLPAGTYTGVLDLSAYTQYSPFEYVAFYMTAGTTANLRALALVDATVSQGSGSTSSTTATTTTTTTTPSQPSGGETTTAPSGTADALLYWHNGARYQTNGTAVSLLTTNGTAVNTTLTSTAGTMSNFTGYTLTAGAEGSYTSTLSTGTTGDWLLFDFTVNGYVDIQLNGYSILKAVGKEYGYKSLSSLDDGQTGLPNGRYTGIVEKSALSLSDASTVTVSVTLGANATAQLNGLMFVSTTGVSTPKEAYVVGGKLYTIDTVHQWILRADGTIQEDGYTSRQEIGSTISGYTGARLNWCEGGQAIYNNATGSTWNYTFNGNHYLYYDFEIDGSMDLKWDNDKDGQGYISLSETIAAQNGVATVDGKLPAGSYGGMIKLSEISGATDFGILFFDMTEGSTVDCYAMAFVDAAAVTDGTSDAPLTVDFDMLGSSIRFGQSDDNTSDIRFGTSFGKGTLYSALCGSDTYAYSGDAAIEFGALMIPTQTLGTNKLNLYTSNVENVVTHYIFSQDSANVLYTSVLLSVPAANRTTPISVRSFMRFKLNGTCYVVYTKTLERSVLTTAQNTLNSGSVAEDQKSQLEDLIEDITGTSVPSTPSSTTTTTTTTTSKPTTTTTTTPVTPDQPVGDTVTVDGNVYVLGDSFKPLIANTGVGAYQGSAYVWSTTAGWNATTVNNSAITKTNYLYYDFTVSGDNSGFKPMLNGYSDETWNITNVIASTYGVTLLDGDKLPAGTYRGVIDVSAYPALSSGSAVFGLTRSTVTLNELAFVTLYGSSGDTPTTSTTTTTKPTTTTTTKSDQGGSTGGDISNEPTEGSSYYYDNGAFFENFENGFPTNKWQTMNGSWGFKSGMSVLASNVSYTSDGILLFRATGDYNATKYSGSCIVSREDYGPGSYEVRMKVMPRLGACTALWTYYNSGYTNHEIDIEYPANTRTFRYNLFTNWLGADPNGVAENDTKVSVSTDPGFYQNDGQWHTYRFDWHTSNNSQSTNGYIEYYVDGVLSHTAYECIPWIAGNITLGVWHPLDWCGEPDFDTAYMLVDYIKYTPYTGETYTDLNYAHPKASNIYPTSPVELPTNNYAANGTLEAGTLGWNFVSGAYRQYSNSWVLRLPSSSASASQVISSVNAGGEYQITCKAMAQTAGSTATVKIEYLNEAKTTVLGSTELNYTEQSLTQRTRKVTLPEGTFFLRITCSGSGSGTFDFDDLYVTQPVREDFTP